MSDTPVDTSKRTWLIASTCAGAVGGVAVAVPFVSTFQPSERAKAAGAAVEVDISALKPGEKMTVEWRGKPVWIVNRTPDWLIPNQNASKTSSRPLTHVTKVVRSSQKFLSPLAFAPIWAVRPLTSFSQAHKLRCLTTGMVASCALATVQPSILLAACLKTSPLQTTSKYRHTCTSPTQSC